MGWWVAVVSGRGWKFLTFVVQTSNVRFSESILEILKIKFQ